MKCILSIDQGTTGTTAVLVNSETFELVGKLNQEFPQIYPSPGLVEHNLNDIWNSTKETIKGVLAKFNVSPSDICSIGITNQRETTCAFKKDSTPLANAIVWQDRRTHDFCSELKAKGLEESVKEKTGLTLDPYFSATKMRWLLNNNDEVKNAHNNNELRFGNIDTYLLNCLTAGESFATEGSNASRTLLMNLKTSEWDNELLDIFSVPKSALPEIKDSFGEFGKTKGLDFLPDGIPITGILGDQQAALFGQAGFNPGDMKCTYGTGAFMLLNTGDEIKKSNNGLLTTVAYKKDGKSFYALEGSCYIAGAAVQWLRDSLQIIPDAPSIEKLSQEIKDLKEMEHILFFPFFTGLGSPYWVSEAKAAIIGLTRDSGRPHMARACLEGMAFSINDLVKAMKNDAGLEIKKLKVDGGAVVNNLLMHMQSTICDLEIIRPQIIETTAYGAALAAAVGTGDINFDQISDLWKLEKSFSPTEDEKSYFSKKVTMWDNYIKRNWI